MTGIEIIELLPDPYRADMKYGDERSGMSYNKDKASSVRNAIGNYCSWSDTIMGYNKWDNIYYIFDNHEHLTGNKLI